MDHFEIEFRILDVEGVLMKMDCRLRTRYVDAYDYVVHNT